MSQTDNRNGMTELLLSLASSRTLSIAEAVERLKRDAHIRTVRETLARYSGMEGADERSLKKKLVELLMNSDPTAKRDSVERKVRLWMRDDSLVISKSGAIQVAYALGLELSQAEEAIVRLCGEGFHWRDPEDIVWIFGLMNGLSYGQATELRQRMADRGLMETPAEESGEAMTSLVRQQVAQLETEEELAEFLKEAQQSLGKLHNTAYNLFVGFMDLLGLPDLGDGMDDVRAISVREIISTYMYNRYIPRARAVGGKRAKVDESVQDAIQRDIRQNWPDETTLSRMLHREMDVTRKVLVLLFLASDGGESAYGDFSDETPEDVFQDMYARMNNMLIDCGFGPLDSRTPFDWMVLYCMCADESIFIEDYVQRFLTGIFPEAEQSEGEEDE